MSILTFKLLSTAAIIAVAVIGGLIPLYAARNENSTRFFSLGNAFAGGLFLGVGFIHLLPEGIEKLEGVTHYPLAAFGFVILLLIDRVVYGDHNVAENAGEDQKLSIHPYVLLVMLSVHSVIAGISLGIESHLSGLMLLLLGILCHKGSESFALMINVLQSGIGKRRNKHILAFFVLMTPLGVLIGMAASLALAERESVTALIEGSFNAIAAGTFIYVAVMDIINAELSSRDVRVAKFVMSVLAGEDDQPMPTRDHDRWFKFVLVLVGIGMMALLVEWAHVH